MRHPAFVTWPSDQHAVRTRRVVGKVNKGPGSRSRAVAYPRIPPLLCRKTNPPDSEPELMSFAPATIDSGVHPGHPPGSERHIGLRSTGEWERVAGDRPECASVSSDEIVTSFQRADAG